MIGTLLASAGAALINKMKAAQGYTNIGGVNIQGQRTGTFGKLMSNLPVVGGLFQGLIDRNNQKRINQQQNAYNMEMSKYSFDRQLDMWNRQNEYNAPKNQMARYGDAGLNPNLIYSQGTPGQATTLPQFQKPEGQFQNKSALQLLPMLSFWQDYRQKEQSINNMKAVQLNQEADTLLKGVNFDWLEGTFAARERQLGYKTEAAKYQLSILQNQARMAMEQIISNINANNAKAALAGSQKKYVDTQESTYNLFKGAGAGSAIFNALIRAASGR